MERMSSYFQSAAFGAVAQVVIGTVWVFHGLYSKLLHGIARHQQIVARVLGKRHAVLATKAIGLGEVALGVWAFTGSERVGCAAVQTAVLVAMNVLEIARARDLLISAMGMAALNAGFLALVWFWATAISR